MRSSTSHRKHDFEDTRSRNPTNISALAGPKNNHCTRKMIILTDSSTLEELNRLEVYLFLAQNA